jgi:Tol biopolymer transport system component
VAGVIVAGVAGGLWNRSLLSDVRPSPPPSDPVLPAPSDTPAASTPFPILAGERWIAYMASIGDVDEDRLWLVRPDGTGRHVIETGLDGQQEHPDWSPEGTRIAFDRWLPDAANPGRDRIDVWVVDADGSNAGRVASCEAPCLQVSMPAWSPDGQSLAVVRFDLMDDGIWGPSHLDVVDVRSGDTRTIASTSDGATAFYDPTWSPDGASVAVALETYPDARELTILSSELAIVPADGSAAPRVVSAKGVWVSGPVWHPTDDWIAFSSRFDIAATRSRTEATELYRIHADGSGLDQVTSFGLGDVRAIQPSWMPDGTSLMYTQVNGFGAGQFAVIAIVGLDGTDLGRIGFGDGTDGRMRPAPT